MVRYKEIIRNPFRAHKWALVEIWAQLIRLEAHFRLILAEAHCLLGGQTDLTL